MAFPTVFLERSAIYNGVLQVRVKSEDLGNDNRAGVRVFDDAGATADILLQFSHKHGDDDVFTAEVPLSQLTGFNTAALQTTSFVDTAGSRVWEQRNHRVIQQGVDTLFPLAYDNQRGTFQSAVSLFSGNLVLDMVTQNDAMAGAYTARRLYAVRAARFEDTRGFFGGAPTVTVALHAEYTVRDADEHARAGIEDLDRQALITLRKQDDGSYAAESHDDNKAFFIATSETGMAADTLDGIRVSVRGEDGKEDSRFGEGYSTP